MGLTCNNYLSNMGFRIQLAITFFILVAEVTFDCSSAQAAYANAQSYSSRYAQGSNFAGGSQGYGNAQGFSNDQNFNNVQSNNGGNSVAYSQSSAGAKSGSNQAGPANNYNGFKYGSTGPSNVNNLGPAPPYSTPSQNNVALADAAADSNNVPANGAQNNVPASDPTWNMNQPPSQVPNYEDWNINLYKGLVPRNDGFGWDTWNDMLQTVSVSVRNMFKQKWKSMTSKWWKCLASPESMDRIQKSSDNMKAAGFDKGKWAQLVMEHWLAVKTTYLFLNSWECWGITAVELSKASVLALKTGNLSCVFTAVNPLVSGWMTDVLQKMGPIVLQLFP